MEKLENNVKLEIKGISKYFGGLKANDDISFKVHEGEIVAIVGDNGAGKSTLIKIISGVLQKNSGEIYVDGEKANIIDRVSARKYKIETVFQEKSLIKNFDAAANLFLGREKFSKNIFGRVFKFLDFMNMKKEAKNLLNTLSIKLDNINSPVNDLSGGQQRSIEVGRAAYWGGKIIIFDEPTNNLGVEQQQKVLSLIKRLRDEFGVSIIVISHDLRHVFDVADKIIVLKNGKKVIEKIKAETTENEIVSMITGAAC
ncbi:MAG: sugar ABC transporter ATP-binding protein [Candidatus Aenigmarchaeota archaeon]|nr:sugar ABC transporter ATP-binding protein [Candidatus Aenigmarchaeota archaeon]